MKHIAQAIVVIVVGAVLSWLAQVIPWAYRYDSTRSNE